MSPYILFIIIINILNIDLNILNDIIIINQLILDL